VTGGEFLKVSSVSKRFGSTEALRGVDLETSQGELLVVLGPTGAGKTTLLRTIAGLETPEAGSVSMDGLDVTTFAPATRDVAIVFQNFSLSPDRTVRQNMEFPLRAPGRNLSRGQIADRVKWAADLLKISHLLDRPATRLSGGEMQRVAIGRAIVRRPRIFLLDEPLTNLDAKLRESLRVELVMLQRELKTPMILVTHDQAEALSMAHRIVVLSEGRVLQTGSPQEIYEKPSSPTVARQLGQPSINIFEQLEPGAVIGVRPEDVATTGGDREAVVKVVEDMGPTFVLLVEWMGQDVRIVVGKSASYNPGQRLFPKFNANRAIRWQHQQDKHAVQR
jgi:multiple sugar transport system ATP-binding protein